MVLSRRETSLQLPSSLRRFESRETRTLGAEYEQAAEPTKENREPCDVSEHRRRLEQQESVRTQTMRKPRSKRTGRVLLTDTGRVPRVNPHFHRLRKETAGRM